MSSRYGGSKKASWPAAARAMARSPGPSPPYQAPSTTAARSRKSWERSASGRTYKVMTRAIATARTAAAYDQTAFDREVGTSGGTYDARRIVEEQCICRRGFRRFPAGFALLAGKGGAMAGCSDPRSEEH